MRAKRSYSRRALRSCVDFHGHLCPGLAIGFQASRVLLKRLGVRRASDEERVAIVENDACGADAVQVMTGCTFGKGNFIFKKYGKHAFSLLDRKKGKGVRVCLRQEAVLGRGEPSGTTDKGRRKTPAAQEVIPPRLSREERIRKILKTAPERLFDIEETKFEMPPLAKVVPSEKCHACGELTKVDLLRTIGGRRLCIPCARRLRAVSSQRKMTRSQKR
jgi:formylmethanofuran dehydrogenase subunit E